MTERDFDAISRLSAWLRDYGGRTTQVFQDDLACVLKIAAESAKEIEQLQKDLNHWKCSHDHQVSLKQKIERRKDLIEEPLHKEIEQLRERLRVCMELFDYESNWSFEPGAVRDYEKLRALYAAARQACKEWE